MPHQSMATSLTWRQRSWGQRVDRVLVGKRPASPAAFPWWQRAMTYVALAGHVLLGRDLRLMVRWCLLLALLLIVGAVVVDVVWWIVQAVTP